MAHAPASLPEKAPPGAPPVFETSRLRLRPWADTDGPGPGQGPDGASLRFMPAGAQPTPDDFPAWLGRRRREMDTGADLHWCVADLATDVMLGNVQVFRMGPPEGRFQGELGYWLRPGARGRGVIGEALRPVTAHAFAPVENGGLGLVRLHAATDAENKPSQAILRAAGFTQWGADHQAWRRADGSLSDGVYFELLAGDRLPDGVPAPQPVAGTEHADIAVEAVTIQGRGVRLRQWRRTDAGRAVQACSDARTRHWLGSLPSPYSLEDADSYIAGRHREAGEGKGVSWCVADPDTDECVGAVAISHLYDALGTAGEVGYWAHPDSRSRGVISEAVRLVVRHAFIPRADGGLGRRRLQINAADGNAASQHIARANGFSQTGRDRRAEPLGDGTFVDLVRFDLLVEEWNAIGRPEPHS